MVLLGVEVIKMQAVVEVPVFDTESPQPWPVASVAAGSWLALDAGCTDEEVGLFVGTLAHRLDVESPGGRDEVVARLLAEEILIVAGGLRLLDMVTGMAVVPGCCAGLEGWRDWGQVLTGGSPWLGHDPWPEVEIGSDGDLRVWQAGGANRHHGRWAGTSVVLPRLILPDLLRNVRQDLVGFLALVKQWTGRSGLGENGTALVEAIDRNFTITAPLDLPID
ncbi:hypothetical protein AB0H42_32575 [Nocardia sp. NPDC050799]|uniref:hypothetical protein n=1 Tax=Nocardia sp. NPDC050799 TaxID=3154842 RepID=UPI0033E08813